MKRKVLYMLVFIAIAIIGHSYIIYRYIHDGILFTGPNDGLEQMIPIQMFLYDHWSHGSWFYASNFGLGGDFFTDLSYYFSTNILFIFNVIGVFILQHLIHIDTNDVAFWTANALVMSIIKSFLALIATFAFAKYITLNRKIAVLAASLFVISPLYFRFTVYWPFFSDIFILLPLLLLSIEKYIQQRKIGLLLIVIILSLINNFYFAYYQLLVGIIYLAIRLIFKHQQDIKLHFRDYVTLCIVAVLGLGSSLFFFFHGIQSYLGNRRIPFNGNVDLFEKLDRNTNIFYDNYLIVILYITIQALLSFKLYKHFYFRLFAILTIISIIASFIPFVDQLFNGMSAPQKRWHFLLAFNAAMLVGLYVKYFKTMSIKGYCFTAIPALAVIFYSAWAYNNTVSWVYFVPVVSLVGLLILFVKESYFRTKLTMIFIITLFILSLLVSIVFIYNQIYFPDHQQRANTNYINESMYSSPMQRDLVSYMKNHKLEGERIDWRVNEQDNTPMYQHFKGTSLYSSIFNHNILDYYYDQLKINMSEESVSRYQSTNGRQNLASLWSVRYLMVKDYQDLGKIPYYFKKIKQQGQYSIYENKYVLPTVKISNHVYDASKLTNPIDREHAMLKGVVVNNAGKAWQHPAKNLLSQSKITTHNMKLLPKYHMKVKDNSGEYVIHIPKKLTNRYKDFYLTLKVKRGLPDSNYTLNINGYINNRLFNNSTYKTGVATQLYKTKPDKHGDIHINVMPRGNYKLEIKSLYGENYKDLKAAVSHNSRLNTYKDINDGVKVNLNQQKSGIASINIPYRKGMRAYVDNKSVTPKKVNYMMTGVPVHKNDKTIIIKYRPPYWYTMCILSFIFIIFSCCFWKFYKSGSS